VKWDEPALALARRGKHSELQATMKVAVRYILPSVFSMGRWIGLVLVVCLSEPVKPALLQAGAAVNNKPEFRFMLTGEHIEALCSVVSNKVCNVIVDVWKEAVRDAVSESMSSWIEDRAVELVYTGKRADFTLRHEDIPWLIPPGAEIRVKGNQATPETDTPEAAAFLASLKKDEPEDD